MAQATAVRCDFRKTCQNFLRALRCTPAFFQPQPHQGPASQPFFKIQLENGADPSTDFPKAGFKTKCSTVSHFPGSADERSYLDAGAWRQEGLGPCGQASHTHCF
eukprot:6827869-Prymnesium_polylepis.1